MKLNSLENGLIESSITILLRFLPLIEGRDMLQGLTSYFRQLVDSVLINSLSETKLDVNFYKSYYADLKSIETKRQIVEHYRQVGEPEGRFPNTQALRKRLLDIDFYRSYYNDIMPMLKDEDVVRHFVVHGSKEGRFPNTQVLRDRLLDVDFYRHYYTDIKSMLDDDDVVSHFINHGLQERRFPSARLLIETMESELGPLPPDFQPEQYQAVNADLADKSDWELKLHYIQHGRREGRSHRFDLSAYEREYERFIVENAKPFDTTPSSQYFHTFAEVLKASNIQPGRWLGRFKLYEFNILNEGWLPRRPVSKIDAIVLFVRFGIDRLAPVALNENFDPNFYVSQNVTLPEGLTANELFRDWLNRGVNKNIYANERIALIHLIGSDEYPVHFDEVKYKSSLNNDTTLPKPGRFNALEHYILHGFSQGRYCPEPREGIAELFFSIGEYHLRNARADIAVAAYSEALRVNPNLSTAKHRRGDALEILKRFEDATDDFIAAASAQGSSVWSHVHAAQGLASRPGCMEAALEHIQRSAAEWCGSSNWRAAGHRVIEQYFSKVRQDTFDLYLQDRREEADTRIIECLRRIVGLIECVDPLPAHLGPADSNLIVLIANRDLPQCDHYRVVQRQKQLECGGWNVEVHDYKRADQCRPALDRASAVIFYRVAAFPAVIHAMLYATALGISTFYDIDDLIFDKAFYPDSFESFEGQITLQEHAGLKSGVPLFRFAMSLCDIGLASTPALAEHLTPLVRSKNCYVIRNGLDDRNDPYLTRPLEPFSKSRITVFYGSGTKAHNKDFNDLVVPALMEIMQRYPNVRLVVAGYLSLDPQIMPFADRVHQLGFDSDVISYWEVLSGADINLSVLSKGTTTDAKSEIKWLEAAALGLPSIVSDTRTYREVIDHGKDGFLASTSRDFFGALEVLITDSKMRREIGERARLKAINCYTADKAVSVLKRLMPAVQLNRPTNIDSGRFFAGINGIDKDQEKPSLHGKNSTRIRVLIVNVFFPPQTIGGATRVVRDNIDFFLDNFAESFEFGVVATDDQVKETYQTRIDSYRGVPVYRIASPREAHMDWRPFNPAMREPFDDVLERFAPDLVHFHCVQRLTATIVEAAYLRGIPYVITVHDAWWISDFQFLVDEDGMVRTPSPDPLHDARSNDINPIRSIARRRRLTRILEKAHRILAVSSAFKDIYVGAGHDKAVAVSNGVSKLAIKPRTLSSTGRVRLGQIGGRTTHKGATLIEAVLRSNSFPNLELTMVDHSMIGGVERHERWGATHVSLVGIVSQEKISDLYAKLDVLLAPSIWPESFGLVTREAQAAGLWVVASNVGAIGECITDGIDGFIVDIKSVEGLTSVLRQIDADPSRFLVSPPANRHPVRTVADQSRDLTEIYTDVKNDASVHR